jgi:hypothetical protein
MWIVKKYRWMIVFVSCWSISVQGQVVLIDSIDKSSGSSRGANKEEEFLPVQSSYTKPFEVGEILIEGNKRTKPYIIARELPFKSGDSVNLTELVQGFEIARQQLMNTRLFNEVVVALKSFRGHVVDVSIQVKERWYIFPIPYIKPVDRNLAEWAKQGYGADRLNYGFKFTYYNFTGRSDKLRLWLITGYSKQIQFLYDQPYADKSLKHGYKVGFSYLSNREVNYATAHNQQIFNDSLSGIKKLQANLEYTYRPGLRTFHSLRLGYVRQEVDSQLLELNPKFFSAGKNILAYPEITYTVNHYNVDYIPYPLKGWMGEASISKKGFNAETNMWQLGAKFTKGFEIGKKTFYGLQGHGVLRYPFDQPFVNHQLFGYGDLYLRGLEKYVVDGVGGLMIRNTLRRELFRFNIPTFIRSTTHDKIPFRIYAKAYTDAGYAHNKMFKQNSLTNRMLYTAGFGVDVVTMYDFILRFDYSFNQLGQNGLFLHIKNEF